MKKILHNLFLLPAFLCFPPLVIAEDAMKKPAQTYSSEWEAGIIYLSEDSFKFGEYTGLKEEAFYPDASFLIRSSPAYDTDDKKIFYELIGTNLGLDSRSLFGEYGELGKYKVYLDFDQLPHFQFDDAFSFFNGAGTANQTLPIGWVRTANDPMILATLNTTFPGTNQVDVKTERIKVGGGFSQSLTEHWQLTGHYHHEIKDGTEILGAVTGTTGGSPASILITPVDYHFDEFDVGISFADKIKQFDFRYNLSIFRNDAPGITWENPFSTGSTTARIGLDPDNQSHQISLSGGYNLGLTSRLSGSLSWSRMLQDETFLPYTTNAALLTVNPSLPRPDLDGEVDKWYGSLNYTIRPMRKLDLAARYTFNKYDNNTPRDVYFRVRNDTATQSASSTRTNRVNRPYSIEQHKTELDTGYQLTRKTRLFLGYEFDWNQRDFTEAEITREHTGKIKLSRNLFTMASGWIEYAHSDRSHSNYDPSRTFSTGTDPAFIPAGCATPPFTDCLDNDIQQRKYYLAERDQDKLTGSLIVIPADPLTLGITGRYSNEDFDETDNGLPIVGLQEVMRYSATLDVGYTPRENIDAYAYYTHEFFEREEVGRIDAATAMNDWQYDTEDRVNTLGAGIKWSKIKGKYNLSADYTFSRAITKIDPTDLPIDTALDFPALETTVHSLSLTGDYQLKDNVIMRLNYLFEYFSNDDWALDNIGQTDIARIIWTGQRSPDYTAHVVGFSVIYKF